MFSGTLVFSKRSLACVLSSLLRHTVYSLLHIWEPLFCVDLGIKRGGHSGLMSRKMYMQFSCVCVCVVVVVYFYIPLRNQRKKLALDDLSCT